jgi:hypothetical protein
MAATSCGSISAVSRRGRTQIFQSRVVNSFI